MLKKLIKEAEFTKRDDFSGEQCGEPNRYRATMARPKFLGKFK